MSEFDFVQDIAVGTRGARAKLVQECLVHHGFHVVPDGQFGPATKAAVSRFQASAGLGAKGIVNRATFTALVAPFKRVMNPIDAGGRNLGQLLVAYAQQHLAEHPHEIGGDNRGPWVRLYMDGWDGDGALWCAGFVCFCLRQACETAGVAMPIVSSFSCDALAFSARANGRLAASRKRVQPGSLFLVRHEHRAEDWTHVGIVTEARDDHFLSIEGNTNDEGSRNGFEVCARTRGYSGKDYILVD